jgi:hypothetical protein
LRLLGGELVHVRVGRRDPVEVKDAVEHAERRTNLLLAVELCEPRFRLTLGRQRDRVDERCARR